MGNHEVPHKEITLSYLKKADDYNTQVLTSVGSYIRCITSDDVPDAKQIKKLITNIEKPISELSKLALTPHLSEGVSLHIKELEKYKAEIAACLKASSMTHETTDKVVNLYHKTSDIDNLIFELLDEE